MTKSSGTWKSGKLVIPDGISISSFARVTLFMHASEMGSGLRLVCPAFKINNPEAQTAQKTCFRAEALNSMELQQQEHLDPESLTWLQALNPIVHMSYSLNSLKGDYIGGNIGNYFRGY